MILVTVGTHEDPFDRLVAAAEALARVVDEPVVVQAGPSSVPTPHCQRHALLPLAELERLVDQARLVVIHGGLGTVDMVLSRGKIPLLVPRRSAWGEQVDDHQVLFAERMRSRVHVVDDPGALVAAIERHEAVCARLSPPRPVFADPEVTARNAEALVQRILARRTGAGGRLRRGLRATLACLLVPDCVR